MVETDFCGLSSGPQTFWHQGLVSWQTIFPGTGGLSLTSAPLHTTTPLYSVHSPRLHYSSPFKAVPQCSQFPFTLQPPLHYSAPLQRSAFYINVTGTALAGGHP